MTDSMQAARKALVTLADCPIGLFLFGSELCLKTEYGSNEGRIDAYIVSSGEFFWGSPPHTIARQREQLVVPLDAQELLAASRSTPAAVAPRVVIVCQECDCEQMLGGCVDCRAAQAAAGRSSHGPRPVAETPMRETLEAASALLREAGWTVEEPKCETCGGDCYVTKEYVTPGGIGSRTIICPTCNGTGKREAEGG